ncbi:MAG: hypothetical protein WC332_10455, partial [Clostridia bacterium]|jgi:hypothetical protein
VKVENIPRWAQENPELAGSLYALHKVVSPIAEGLGLVGGGMVGAGTAGPVGAIAGAGLGYAGAERMKKIGSQALGIDQTETLPQAMTQTGKDIVSGAGMEAGGQIAGRVIQYGAEKLLQPFAKQVTPAMKEVADIAKKEGITLSPAELTQSKSLGLMEKALGFIPGSSGAIQREELNQLMQLSNVRERLLQKLSEGKGVPDSLEKVGLNIKNTVDSLITKSEAAKKKGVRQVADDLLRRAGSTDTYESLGMKTQDLIKQASEKAVAKKNAIYREIGQYIPEGDYPIAKTTGVAEEALKRVENSLNPDTTLVKVLKKILRQGEADPETTKILDTIKDYPEKVQKQILESQGIDLSAAQYQPRNWSNLQNMRSELNSLIARENQAIGKGAEGFKGQGTVESNVYGRLKKALDADMESVAQRVGSQAKDKLDIANAFYREEFAPVWKNKDIQRLVYSKPEAVVDNILRPNNITEIKTLKKAIGEGGYKPLKEKFVSRLIENAGKGEGGFTWEKAASQLEKYRPEELKEILGDNANVVLGAITKGMNKESIPVADRFLVGVIKKSTPETVMNMVFHPNNAGNVNLIKNVVGKDTFDEAKTAFTAKLLKMSEYGSYRPIPSVRAMSQFDEPTLSAIYSSEERVALDNLMKLSKAAQGAERLAGNPSGTAQSVITFQQGRAVLTNMAKGRPDIATAIWFLPKGLAKIYLSPVGRKYFTTGFNVPVGTEANANIASKLMAIAGKDGYEIMSEGR